MSQLATPCELSPHKMVKIQFRRSGISIEPIVPPFCVIVGSNDLFKYTPFFRRPISTVDPIYFNIVIHTLQFTNIIIFFQTI